MLDFIKRNAVFLAVSLITLVLIVGGVFIFSRPNTPKKANSDLLVAKDSYQTNPGAAVTLVEFGDYECPACASYNPLVNQVLKDFDGTLNFVFRNFPLPQHTNANISSYAAEAAGLQGKFWQMHDKLYGSQSDWATSSDAKTIFIGYAKDLGLNTAKFSQDIDSQAIKDKVAKDEADGNLLGINQTPTFYVNGIMIQNLPGNYTDFKAVINDAIKNIPAPSSTPSAYHIHFDLKTYINGTAINFKLPKYQESESNSLDENIHFHNGNGDVVHVHKVGVALGELFSSLKITFPKDTFANSLKVYVNGNLNLQGLNYVPQDLNKILVTYGPSSDVGLNSQLSTVTDTACIYSLKCPDRGSPPPENCAGGVGSGCSK